MPFTAPFRRPRVYEARIILDNDQFYHDAANGTDPGKLAQVAVVDDDRGEPWATVAWLPDNPSEWWIGRFPFPPHDSYPPILGAAEVIFAADMDADMLLVETPMRWCELASSAKWPGPCTAILDWGRPDAVGLWLSFVKAVRPESPTLAHAVKSVLDSEPARHRLRVRLAEPEKPASEAAPERVDLDQGTILEPFPVREPGAARLDTQREEAAE